MNNKNFLGAVLMVALISGCAVTPNPEAIGPYPSDYKETIKAHILRTYFDPYSVRSASVSMPREGHLFFQQGWIVCLEANAKNRMGGYIGIKRTAYLINRRSVVQTMDNAPLCDNSNTYLYPWPELEQIR